MADRGCLADIDVVILAGGLGTRLRSVLPETPKILAPIAGRNFLDILLDRLAGFGARRVILALGHLADRVERHVAAHPRAGLEIDCIVEPAPLGTAGALRFARQHISSNRVIVMNGDTFVDVDLCTFVAAHRAAGADASMVCTRIADASRYGTVEIGSDGRIAAFREKTVGQGPGAINAGIYLLESEFLDRVCGWDRPSLERDIFESLPPGTLAAYVGDFPFIDIGTPEDLARASAPGGAIEVALRSMNRMA